MTYCFKPSALQDLRKLPKSLRKRILLKLDFFCASQNPLKFAKPMKDNRFGQYRFRIGDYRIIFDLDPNTEEVIVLAVGHRKDVYR
ncbi:MAG: type II toxin-antitoxin system mRNA interferase toxin, RelE/StbE family [Acidobacteria bacterium]|nr:MAG: type II toxin-antitoxin system mRNA interferase toxin, RelE/StbE family [Acidobacteriota bacterium]